MTISPPSPAASSAFGSHNVLTHHLLLPLITSFQRGIPGTAQSLVLRFIGDGLALCTNVSNLRIPGVTIPHWYVMSPQHPRMVTPLYNDVRPWHHWLDHLLPQAIATYDDSLHVLQAWLRSSVVAHANHSQRTRDKIVHRVTEAAAAFGRVYLLTWLHEYQQQRELQFQFQHHTITDDDAGWESEPSTQAKRQQQQQQRRQRLVRLAGRYGHVDVLVWIETTFGRSSLRTVVDRSTVRKAVYAGHVDVLRWLAERRLCVIARTADRVAINRGHMALLRFLLEECSADVFPHEQPCSELVELAVARGHAAMVQYLFQVRRPRVVHNLIAAAVGHGRLDIATFLLHQRGDHCTACAQSPADMVCHHDIAAMQKAASMRNWIRCDVLQYTRFETTATHAMIEILLPTSTPEQTVLALIWTSLYARPMATFILEVANKKLPLGAATFARAVMESAPVYPRCWSATSFFYRILTRWSKPSEYRYHLWYATRLELRAALLYFVWQKPDGNELPETLAFIAARHKTLSLDRAFLELCVSLCSTPKSRSCVQSHLDNIHDD